MRSTNELLTILRTMDVPKNRISTDVIDQWWLVRNLGVRNSKHPKYKRAMELLTKKQS